MQTIFHHNEAKVTLHLQRQPFTLPSIVQQVSFKPDQLESTLDKLEKIASALQKIKTLRQEISAMPAAAMLLQSDSLRGLLQ